MSQQYGHQKDNKKANNKNNAKNQKSEEAATKKETDNATSYSGPWIMKILAIPTILPLVISQIVIFVRDAEIINPIVIVNLLLIDF